MLLTSKVEEGVQILNSMAIQNRECKGLHIILLTGGMQDSKVETTIQHFAEGIIVFTTRWEAAETSRSLLIKKMLGGFAPSRRLPYSIGERGFTVETAIRIT
jgi:KaiC/GvpD/RAD55 family RecA-like ATPase